MIASMEGGGSERQTLLMLRHLTRERFQPELFVLRRGGSLYDEIPDDVPVHCFEDTPPTFRIPWPGRIHQAQVAALEKILRERAIDVIYDRTFHMSLIAGPAAASVGVPRVSTIVSPPSYAVPQNAGRFIGIKRRRLAKAYAEAAKVIAVSRPAAADARRFYGLKPHQICSVPNPVDSEQLDAVISSQPIPARDSRYTIVCVGRMTREKGHACLIKAFANLRASDGSLRIPRLWLIGDGPLRADLEAMSRKYQLSDAIEFLGHLNQPAPWIAAADALCLPSIYEGFPNVMLEAMALGTPVIASDIEVVRSLGRVPYDARDRGRDYVTMFRSGDAVQLASKIRRLRSNPTGTRSRMLSAKNLARRAHAIGAIVPRLESIMLKAAGLQIDLPSVVQNNDD
jgi:glycosyltransferase involved in cell wall biosynthesis